MHFEVFAAHICWVQFAGYFSSGSILRREPNRELESNDFAYGSARPETYERCRQ